MSAVPDTAADLSIRSAPRPVRRFSKKALALVLGGASLLVLASVGIAMSPRDRDGTGAQRELYSTSNKPRAEGLSVLPAGYGQLPAGRAVPELGPPLPGDLGEPILRAQREGRIQFEDAIAAVPAPEDEAALLRAAEAEARAAARALEARESGLFFSVSGERSGAAVPATPQGFAGVPPVDPFAALAGLASGDGRTASAFEDPNRQDRKESFLDDVQDRSIYNPHRLETPVSPYQVMAGTVIPATLLTGVNSDLPGQVIAQVTEPVYDTVTGEYLLIPQGTRVIGRYDSVIAYGQSRALIVWSRLVLPDGTSLRIENLPGVDARGQAGLSDRTDNHTLRIFSAAALSSLISIGAELGEDDDDDIARALREATQDGASRVGDEVVRRQLNVQPTLTIRPGWRFRILVHQDLILRPYGAPS